MHCIVWWAQPPHIVTKIPDGIVVTLLHIRLIAAHRSCRAYLTGDASSMRTFEQAFQQPQQLVEQEVSSTDLPSCRLSVVFACMSLHAFGLPAVGRAPVAGSGPPAPEILFRSLCPQLQLLMGVRRLMSLTLSC